MPIRPNTVIMIAFATGSVTISCAKSKAEVNALMNCGNDEEVRIPSISETDVMTDKRDQKPTYRLVNEEIHFRRGLVVFWSVSESAEPKPDPLIGLLNPQGVIHR